MNFFKAYFIRRRSKKSVQQLESLRRTFDILAKSENTGLVTFDAKHRYLYIEDSLAILMMRTPETWQNFMQNCFTWLYWRQCNEAWSQYIKDEELKAVRRVRRKTVTLSKKDVERIREARRKEIGMSDIEPPKVEPFEFFVVKTNARIDTKEKGKAVPGGEILSVGNYNPTTNRMEIALWEDVRKFYKQ